MVGRAVLTAVNDTTGLADRPGCGLASDEIIDGAERMQLYGITSHPLKGADVLVLSVGGVQAASGRADRRPPPPREETSRKAKSVIYTNSDESR